MTVNSAAAQSSSAGPGRRRSTTAHALERAAFELFDRHGFEATTVGDIATAAGIGRRTFFRYFDSKNDVVWGDFDAHLRTMRERFARVPAGEPPLDALRTVVVEFNRFDPAQIPWHRDRMRLILGVPALQAHAALRYHAWRTVVADFAAERLGVPASDLVPGALAHAALGVAIAAYEHWLADDTRELPGILDEAFRNLAAGFRL
ncbi:mycofactocin system transcriptional regulator [Nocardia sp. NPDC057668]|uniref:mycofactocin system transcriptional regulator n=1 Tax=Nocardia sp. NPDC057668 TaxID=3346202 RepID=UPI00366EF5F6